MPEAPQLESPPLSGVRVLDITTMASGPFATAILAQQGADVVKVEAPSGGDPMRHIGPSRSGLSSLFFNFNRGKRSLVLDLAHSQGSELLVRLARDADVFVQNMRPGVAERLGIGAEHLRAQSPELIYVSINGFGEEGPMAKRKAYDSVVQALSGAAALQPESDSQQPRFINNAIFDKLSGLSAAQAIGSALYARERGAGGQHIQLAMLDAALAFLWPDAMQDQTWLDSDGAPEPAERARTPRVRQTADGWITFSTWSDEEFRALCRALDLAELPDDPRFRNRDSRLRHESSIDDLFDTRLATLDTAEWIRRFEAEDVPHARVNRLGDVARDPQVVASGSLSDSIEAGFDRTRVALPAVRFGSRRSTLASPAPRLGQHSDEILGEFGLEAAEIASLREQGVVS